MLRGALNVLSLGMDEIAAKPQHMGLHATVHSHLVWPLLADEAAADYKSARVRTIIVVGHNGSRLAVPQLRSIQPHKLLHSGGTNQCFVDKVK